MAEAFLRKYGGERFNVYSAGLVPAGVHPLTIQVMDEVGIDIRNQRSKSVSEYLGRVEFAYVIFVCSQAEKHCPRLYPGVPAQISWPFEDPVAFDGTPEQRLEKFREVRDMICRRVREWLAVMGPSA